MKNKKEVFTVTVMDEVTKQENKLELAILVPTVPMLAHARAEESRAFSSAMENKAPPRARLDKYMREQGLWDDEKEAEAIRLGGRINNNLKKIDKGGCPLSEAKEAAIDVRRARADVVILMSEKTNLDAHTLEGQTENVRFNCLLAQSVVYNESGERYFHSTEDYLDRQDSDLAVQAATLFAKIYYGVDNSYYKNLPENQFLLNYKMCNKDLHLIDKQGRLVDEFGELVDEDGFVLNESGNRIDSDGDERDKDGKLIVKQLPFTDDDGDEVGKDGVKLTPLPAQKKVGRPTKKTTKTTKTAKK